MQPSFVLQSGLNLNQALNLGFGGNVLRRMLSRVKKSSAKPKQAGGSFDASGLPRLPETSADRRAGDVARNRRQWEKAISRYSRHLARFPEDLAIWVQVGHAYKEIGDLEGAHSAYQKALDLDPRDADLLLNLGHLEKMRGNLATATLYYRRSFAIDRNSFAAGELRDSSLRPYLLEAERTVLGDGLIRPSAICRGRLEAISGWRAEGWVVGGSGRGLPEVLFFQDGRFVGSTRPTMFRPDLFEHDIGTGLVGFEAELDLDFRNTDSISVSARIARSGQQLDNSPLDVSAPEELARWLRGNANLRGHELSLIRELANRADAGPLSIIMPVYNPRADWLREALESVVQQWCDAWELICVDDASNQPHVREILTEYAVRDIRIRPLYLEENGGISCATNRGIAAARGDYIAFMDHDDVLEPEAVWRMLDAARHDPSLIYSDEAITGRSTEIIRHIVARPAFSYDYYLSHPYFVHFIAVRRELVVAVAGLNEQMNISADVDFVLRVLEKSATIAHVPAVLYRWRTHDTSTGHARISAVTKATLGALNGHLRRLGVRATASEGLAFNGYRIDYEDDPAPTLIIIPTKNRADLLRRAISSILATTSRNNVDIMVIDHDSEEKALRDYLKSNNIVRTIRYSGAFNFAKMNNVAVSAAERHYKYVLFCNNDIEAFEPGWLEHMRGLCSRSDVGVVGATLLYPDNTIQHSGVVMGLSPLADHAHKFKPYMRSENGRNVGYNYSLIAIREYSAVTAACMIMRRDIFDAVGGFDEEFAIGFNDTDLCLRVGTAGYKILLDPYAVLYHHESATRANISRIDHPEDAAHLRRRWSSLLECGDPFYSPLLALQPPDDHNKARPDKPYWGVRIRPVVLPKVDVPLRSERYVADISTP